MTVAELEVVTEFLNPPNSAPPPPRIEAPLGFQPIFRIVALIGFYSGGVYSVLGIMHTESKISSSQSMFPSKKNGNEMGGEKNSMGTYGKSMTSLLGLASLFPGE